MGSPSKNEHAALKEYVLQLQSRLFELQGEYPPPPGGLNLNPNPNPQPPPILEESVDPMDEDEHEPAPPTPLEAVAQAVAGLAQEQLNERRSFQVIEPGLRRRGYQIAPGRKPAPLVIGSIEKGFFLP